MLNQNKGVASVTPSVSLENQSQAAREKWFSEYPTREEVTNFVSGYINNEVVPIIMNSVGKDLFQLKCRNEILLKCLIDAGLCTPESFEENYAEYIKEQTEQAIKRQEQIRKENDSNKIIVPNKTIIH